jgi:hypothetical protein
MQSVKLGARIGSVLVVGLLLGACGAQPGDAESGGTEEIGSVDSSLINLGGVFYDSGTQCTVGGGTMHCCPSGSVMIGAHVNDNVFKCAWLGSTPGPRFLDVGTQRNSMHACPFGQLMVGLHAANNWLVCQNPGTTVQFEYVDTGTQDGYPMHVCASGYAMAGIHVAQNRFSCDF